MSLKNLKLSKVLLSIVGFVCGIVVWTVCRMEERQDIGMPHNFGVTIVPRIIQPVARPVWNGKCNKIHYNPPPSGAFNCPRLSLGPLPMICVIRGERSDVSRLLYMNELHERERFQLFQAQLLQDPDAHVVDIGSIYGTFGLLAAKMNCNVVFVQSNHSHLDMVISSMLASGRDRRDRGTFVLNILYNKYTLLPITNSGVNIKNVDKVPTIFLDDLLEVTTFNKSIIVMDLGRNDIYAIHQGHKFFSSIKVTFIFMKFKPEVRTNYRILFSDMFNLLLQKHYRPYSLSLFLLDAVDVREWPRDVVWKHEDAEFVDTKHFFVE